MSLSSELILQFAKSTKDEKETRTETTVYGTVVEQDGTKYVRLDGSDLLTPAVMTVDAVDGERVLVRLKNHTATITGNLSSPAVRTETVKVVLQTVDDLEFTFDGLVHEDTLKVEQERITALENNVVNLEDTTLTRTAAADTYATKTELEETNSNLGITNADVEALLTRIQELEERVTALEPTEEEGDESV